MKAEFIYDRELQESIINSCDFCVLSMVDGDLPYAIPMSFNFIDGKIYLHSGPEGEKLKILSKNRRVQLVFTAPDREVVWRDSHVGCSYSMRCRSVLVSGEVNFITENSRKKELMQQFMQKYTPNEVRFSEPAIKNLVIWEIVIEKMSGKDIGIQPDKRK